MHFSAAVRPPLVISWAHRSVQPRCIVNVLVEGTRMQQRMLFHVFSVLLCCAAVSPVAAELTPQQIAVVVNRSSRESVQVGHHYAKQRGVPGTQVIPLELGAMKEAISRQEYE